MNPKYHIIRNFPKKGGLFPRLWGNIEFFVATTPISFRKNLLSVEDYKLSRSLLKKGDVVLVGAFRRLSRFFIRGVVTHASLYCGRGYLVHSVPDGVEKAKYSELFDHYDTLVILRPKVSSLERNSVISKAVKFAEAQLGKPFNFRFSKSHNHKEFFCSQLVNDAFLSAGFNTLLENNRSFSNTLRPKDFLSSPMFKKVFVSESLKSRQGVYGQGKSKV